jgi:hypothetical protein
MRVALIVAWMTPLLAAGCASEAKPEPEPAVSTPLELDPTQDYEVAAWWTNGDQLLHLGEGNAYTLYESVNRYRKPAQRGRWSQQSYAAIRLEPYAERPRDAIRGSMRRVGRTLMLSLPGLELMRSIDGPPPVLEDRLLGRWSAEFGTLRLDGDLRYVYTLYPGRARPPAAVTKHGGTWRVEDDAVILRPDSAGVGPVLVRILETNGMILLEAPDGQLAHQAPLVEGG